MTNENKQEPVIFQARLREQGNSWVLTTDASSKDLLELGALYTVSMVWKAPPKTPDDKTQEGE